MKLYYLYEESSTKLRSLNQLVKDLDGLVDLVDNPTEDNGVAPIKACGTRWIGHLVNALQRAINKFGIYLKDLENFARGLKKAKTKAEILGYINKWRDYRYLLGMGFFLHVLMPLKELSLGWQKTLVTAVDQERRLEKALDDLALLKTICDNGRILELPYVKTLLENTKDDGLFQDFKFNYLERAKTTIVSNASIWVEKVTECVRNRFDSDTNKVIVNAAYVNVNDDTSEVATEDGKDSTSDNFSICESSESDDEVLKRRQ